MLLTGTNPFRADNLNAINHRITHENVPSLEEFRRDLPDGLDYMVRRMLKKDPAHRYATGLELAADLAVIFEDLEAIHDESRLKEKFNAVKHLGFFKEFEDAEIWDLIGASDWQNYKKGDMIIREGDEDRSFYVVLSGLADVEKNQQRIHTVQPGDCFGEMGYLAQTRRTASVVAKTDVSMMKINSSTIDRASVVAQLRFHKVFVQVLIERLSETTAALSSPAHNPPH